MVAAASKGITTGKAAGPTGVVNDIMKVSGCFGTRWMTDLINNIVKEGCFPDDWRKFVLTPVYKGKGVPLMYGSYITMRLLEKLMNVLERVLEKRIICQLMTCSLESYLSKKPLMLFSSYDKFRRCTKQERRRYAMLLEIWGIF